MSRSLKPLIRRKSRSRKPCNINLFFTSHFNSGIISGYQSTVSYTCIPYIRDTVLNISMIVILKTEGLYVESSLSFIEPESF